MKARGRMRQAIFLTAADSNAPVGASMALPLKRHFADIRDWTLTMRRFGRSGKVGRRVLTSE
jgi:hypothetical protein